MIECGVTNLEPWALLHGSEQLQRMQHVGEVFPGWGVVPFARRTDNDEVACWTGESVVVIDDFDVVRDAGGDAVRRPTSEYSSIDEWLLMAVEEFIEFD
ncbi:hypothetical protein [Pseudarthrobacter siccitolerans]